MRIRHRSVPVLALMIAFLVQTAGGASTCARSKAPQGMSAAAAVAGARVALEASASLERGAATEERDTRVPIDSSKDAAPCSPALMPVDHVTAAYPQLQSGNPASTDGTPSSADFPPDFRPPRLI